MEQTALAPRPVTVTVTIVDDEPKKFTMQAGVGNLPIKPGKTSSEDMLVFDNNQGNSYQPGFTVTFKLVDQTGKGYRFFQKPNGPSPNDAMSVDLVKPNAKCPNPGAVWEGFKPTGLDPSATVLTVENPNDYPQYFCFAFNFALPGAPRPTLVFDPTGNNQNGDPPDLIDPPRG